MDLSCYSPVLSATATRYKTHPPNLNKVWPSSSNDDVCCKQTSVSPYNNRMPLKMVISPVAVRSESVHDSPKTSVALCKYDESIKESFSKMQESFQSWLKTDGNIHSLKHFKSKTAGRKSSRKNSLQHNVSSRIHEETPSQSRLISGVYQNCHMPVPLTHYDLLMASRKDHKFYNETKNPTNGISVMDKICSKQVESDHTMFGDTSYSPKSFDEREKDEFSTDVDIYNISNDSEQGNFPEEIDMHNIHMRQPIDESTENIDTLIFELHQETKIYSSHCGNVREYEMFWEPNKYTDEFLTFDQEDYEDNSNRISFENNDFEGMAYGNNGFAIENEQLQSSDSEDTEHEGLNLF